MSELPTSNNTLAPHYYWIVGVWLLWVIIGFAYLVNQRLVQFDPTHQLLNVTEQQLVAQVQQQNNQLPQIYHLVDENCHCTSLLKEHREQINRAAIEDGFNIVELDVSDSKIASLIPATPAIVIVGKNAQLLYVGPYATGLDCSADNSLVGVVLSNYRQGFAAPTVIDDATGCYCRR